MNAKSSAQRERESFCSGHGRGFVRERVAYYESTGDLRPGDVTPADLADSVLPRACGEFAGGSAAQGVQEPRELPMGASLKQLAAKQLESIVQRLRATRGRGIYLNEDIPETLRRKRSSILINPTKI